MVEKFKKPNKLIHEKSPYLLQHAYNPVNWYPWGEEALTKAKADDKLIFFSCGYSTCHWCHVMERESFESEAVAEVMNEHYVAIKVDREERPDLDHIYMEACQLMTGHGGWPLNVILTPDRLPVFAGTYFPRQDRLGMPGLVRILKSIAELWQHDRKRLLASAQAVMEELQQQQGTPTSDFMLGRDTLELALEMYTRVYDQQWGGFGQAPKFPTPHNLVFLLRYGQLTGNHEAVAMATGTLRRMYQGGIYDHIGGGFARYSTDKKWLVPHFEKMLYDNALLALAYLEAARITRDSWYAGVAREIFKYLKREMLSPEGGFYSAQDADSEGKEGLFYLWTPEQIVEELGEETGRRFCKQFDITPEGNFEGKSIPNLTKSGITSIDEWAEAKEKLYQVRARRIPPFKDDKILTAWNGLMIAALAMGYRLLDEPDYRQMAERAAGFILDKLCRKDGRLLVRYREGEAAYLGNIDDYAFFIWGLLELHQATLETRWLLEAVSLSSKMLELFWDEKQGGLYYTGKDAIEQIIRPKEIYDGATPSGNSVAALTLARLGRLTSNLELEEKAVAIVKAFAQQVAAYPIGYAHLLQAVTFLQFPTREVVLVGSPEEAGFNALAQTAKALADAQTVVMAYHPGTTQAQDMLAIAPYLEGYQNQAQGTAYVCHNYICQQPLTEPGALANALH